MADVDTQLLADQHSTIRLEQQKQAFDLSRQTGDATNEIVKEGLKGDYATQSKINDLERASSSQIDMFEDVVNNQFMTVSRDTADLRAQVTGLGYQVRDGHAALAKDVELNALKGIIEGQRNTTYISDKIAADGERTRALISDLKYHDLNRGLVERNAALVEAEAERRHWRHHADQNQWAGQFAAIQSQLQAFNSQMQETRQGMVNFGTMAGVGQTSTSNNVR